MADLLYHAGQMAGFGLCAVLLLNIYRENNRV